MTRTEFSTAMYKKGWRVCQGMSGYVIITPERNVLVFWGVAASAKQAWTMLEKVVSEGRLEEYIQPPNGDGVLAGIDYTVNADVFKICEDEDHSFGGGQ